MIIESFFVVYKLLKNNSIQLAKVIFFFKKKRYFFALMEIISVTTMLFLNIQNRYIFFSTNCQLMTCQNSLR